MSRWTSETSASLLSFLPSTTDMTRPWLVFQDSPSSKSTLCGRQVTFLFPPQQCKSTWSASLGQLLSQLSAGSNSQCGSFFLGHAYILLHGRPCRNKKDQAGRFYPVWATGLDEITCCQPDFAGVAGAYLIWPMDSSLSYVWLCSHNIILSNHEYLQCVHIAVPVLKTSPLCVKYAGSYCMLFLSLRMQEDNVLNSFPAGSFGIHESLRR